MKQKIHLNTTLAFIFFVMLTIGAGVFWQLLMQNTWYLSFPFYYIGAIVALSYFKDVGRIELVVNVLAWPIWWCYNLFRYYGFIPKSIVTFSGCFFILTFFVYGVILLEAIAGQWYTSCGFSAENLLCLLFTICLIICSSPGLESFLNRYIFKHLSNPNEKYDAVYVKHFIYFCYIFMIVKSPISEQNGLDVDIVTQLFSRSLMIFFAVNSAVSAR